MPFLQKKQFCSQPPKEHYFLFYFEIYLFHSFIFSLFPFSIIKKTKTKNERFFENPFWLSDKLQNNDFRTPTHDLWFLRYSPKHYKTGGESSKYKSWTKFWPDLGPNFDSKKTNLGPSFDSTAQRNIYIYIHTYTLISICVCVVQHPLHPYQTTLHIMHAAVQYYVQIVLCFGVV